MLAKSSFIPSTFLHFTTGINVQVDAFVAITALSVFTKEPTLWHLFHVVFVQKFTVVPFLAKASKPVLAHYRLLEPRMLVGTSCALGTRSFQVELTDRV
jgi:hypothetical protein